MAKIKLTKGELKRQRDALKQFERYLPTLQLKKQQLQLEILQQNTLLENVRQSLIKKTQNALIWAGLLAEAQPDLRQLLLPEKIITNARNIAGVDIPVFEKAEFEEKEYDLFQMPLWLDAVILHLREIFVLQREAAVLTEGVNILRRELRVTTQRVNLFEKVKIPEADQNIRLIKIYIGDQMANAVGRCKAAKRKIEEQVLAEAAL